MIIAVGVGFLLCLVLFYVLIIIIIKPSYKVK